MCGAIWIMSASATPKRHPPLPGYLADLGHRHIAYLGGTDMTIVRKDRISGYRQLLTARGAGSRASYGTPKTTSSRGAMPCLRWVRRPPENDGRCLQWRHGCAGASLALVRSGLRPGRDLSIIGFDDIQDAAVATPPLTTMAVRPQKLGRKLAQVLLDRMKDPEMPPTVMNISAELVERETTGAPHNADST